MLPGGKLGPLKPLLKQVPEPNARAGRISPDGQLVAYTTNDPGQVDVFLARFPSGEGQWQVGTQGGMRPRWTRDSGELIFIAGSGPTERSMVSARVDPSLDSPLGKLTLLFSSRGDGDLRISTSLPTDDDTRLPERTAASMDRLDTWSWWKTRGRN